MKSLFWGCEQAMHLVAGQATVVWLLLNSPFGDSPAGLDVSLHLPEGLDLLDPGHRPVFGVGPDAHRPVFSRDNGCAYLSFPGFIPGENERRPFTHRDSWCDLFYPLVMVASPQADGSELRIDCHAMGDSDHCGLDIVVYDEPEPNGAVKARRNIEPNFLPWFSHEEQGEIAAGFQRCGFTDITLNWYNHGIPFLPPDAYTITAKVLRREMSGVNIWIGGMPGADTIVPRAEDIYGRPIPHIASPEAVISQCPDIVVASERSWVNAVDADGVMITITEPTLIDSPFMPAHCFSRASRLRFAQEHDLESVPDPIVILDHHREAWVDFSCRQIRRMLEVGRMGIGERPLALCALGPSGAAREVAGVDWDELSQVADVMIYAHHQSISSDVHAKRWGMTRIGSSPHLWWEEHHDTLGPVEDPEVVAADMKMQLALSGNNGVRLWSWPCLRGQVQRQLMEWR